jgi:hypothetical protein
MSELLEEFVEPYREVARTKEAFEKLLTLAVIAWNVTLFPEEDRQPHLKEIISEIPADARDDGKRIIEEMMERKQRFFSQSRRTILGFELTDTGTGWHLSVTSTASPV